MPGKILNGLAEIYLKPTTGQVVIRKIHSNQRSEKLKEVQRKFATRMAGNKVASQCKGKKAKEFWSCLRTKNPLLGKTL